MNLTKLFVTLLSITFADPNQSSMCKDADCNLLYTPSTVRVTDCDCNETVHSFSYPKGYDSIYVNYSMTHPITHDFYQNDCLIGSCPKGLMCSDNFRLNPKKKLMTVIREDQDQDQEEKTVLYSNDNYELIFNKKM
jgi:hypothetical protein